MGAPNKATLEKIMQVALKNKKAGTEVSTSILAVEALVVSGIAENAMVENLDKSFLARCRAGAAHKAYGKRLADAVSTIDSIIAAEGLVIVDVDEVLIPSTNKQKLTRVATDAFARKDAGIAIAKLVPKCSQAVDQLMVVYAANAPVLAALTAIRAILVA